MHFKSFLRLFVQKTETRAIQRRGHRLDAAVAADRSQLAMVVRLVRGVRGTCLLQFAFRPFELATIFTNYFH